MNRAVRSSVLLLVGLTLFAAAGARGGTAPQLAASGVDLVEGLAALQDGRDAEAADWFAEAARLNPDDGTPHYWHGLALLRLGRPAEAATELEASLAARYPPEVARERVLADLDIARKAGPEPVRLEIPDVVPAARPIDDRGLWEGNLGLEAGTDSNPNLLSKELVLPRPGGGLVRGEEGDSSGLLGAQIGFYPFHARESPNLGVSLEARRSFHRDFSYLDLDTTRGLVGISFGRDPLGFLEGPLGTLRAPFGTSRMSILLQAGGSDYRLNGASYLRVWEGAASVLFQETPGTATRLDFADMSRDFSGSGLSDPRQSGRDLSLQVSQLFYFGRRDRVFRVGALAMDRQAHRAFAESRLAGSAGLKWPLGLRWKVELEGELSRDRYDNRESNLFDTTGPPRRDTLRRGALALIWVATDRLRWTARGSFASRTSNVDLGDTLPDLDYRQTTFTLGMGWTF
jgi:hypothetical protein